MLQPCVDEDLFLPSHRCLTPPSWGTPCDINAIYTSLKSTFSGLQFHCWQYGSIFICLAVIASKTWEVSRNSKRIWPYSSSRSSILVSMESPYVTSCYLLIVTLAVSATVFEIFTLKDRKLLILPTTSCLTPPLGGNPLEFLDETYPAKTRGMGLPCGENFIILTSTVFVWSTRLADGRTDGRTDWRAIAYTR